MAEADVTAKDGGEALRRLTNCVITWLSQWDCGENEARTRLLYRSFFQFHFSSLRLRSVAGKKYGTRAREDAQRGPTLIATDAKPIISFTRTNRNTAKNKNEIIEIELNNGRGGRSFVARQKATDSKITSVFTRQRTICVFATTKVLNG